MKKRFTEEQIIKILNEQETRKKVEDIAIEYSRSKNTFFNWKKSTTE